MELESLVAEHETKLKQHDMELERLNNMSIVMQNSINASLSRVDESNKFLREQNREQLKQNNEIFQIVVGINENKENKEYEAKMMTRKNLWQVIFSVGAFLGGFILAYFKVKF